MRPGLVQEDGEAEARSGPDEDLGPEPVPAGIYGWAACGKGGRIRVGGKW